MMRQVIAVIAGACVLSALTACSVGMALSGEKEPNLGAFNVGSTRGEAELQLGSPVSSVTNPNGTRTDIYEYELGNEPSAGRAVAHGVMDILTLGLWEVVGTPIEAIQVSKHRITLVYSQDDKIVSINQARVPPPDTEGTKGEEEPPFSPEVNIAVLKGGPGTSATNGTCFAVNQNGTLLTAYHIVQDATSIRVHLEDGTVTEATVKTFNAKRDLAILRIDPSTPDFLPLAPTGSVNLGEQVFTMGYPAPELLGQEPRFTDGSVSALSGPEGEVGLLQISVPVQPGNSGGPLVNERGEVVGIVTSTTAVEAFLSKTGALPQNVNWAVNVDYARRLFASPTVESATVSREDAIENVRRALCMVETSSPNDLLRRRQKQEKKQEPPEQQAPDPYAG